MGFAGLVLLNLVFGIVMLVRGRHQPLDPRLAGEQLAIAQLADVHYLFFSPGSHADLLAARPDLVAAANERAFAVGLQTPSEFRSLDHQRQFDALLLSGDPTTYKPLLHHLADSKDFVLTWLDNANLIFRRPVSYTHLDVYKRQELDWLPDNEKEVREIIPDPKNRRDDRI